MSAHAHHHEVDRNDPASIDFRAESGFAAKIAGFTAETCTEGAVVILLGEGGQHLRRVYVDGEKDFLDQVDAAIDALTRAREVMGRLKALN